MYEHKASIQDLDFVKMPRDAAASTKTSQKVKGYQIQTDMDRKLLLGIWELDREDVSVEHEKDSDYLNQSDITATNVSVN